MSERRTAPCRVDVRTLPAHFLKEQTGRLESLWATGCTILTPQPPVSDTLQELRIHLPDGDWPSAWNHDSGITPKMYLRGGYRKLSDWWGNMGTPSSCTSESTYPRSAAVAGLSRIRTRFGDSSKRSWGFSRTLPNHGGRCDDTLQCAEGDDMQGDPLVRRTSRRGSGDWISQCPAASWKPHSYWNGGKPSNSGCTWTANGPCALIWASCGGHRRARRD